MASDLMLVLLLLLCNRGDAFLTGASHTVGVVPCTQHKTAINSDCRGGGVGASALPRRNRSTLNSSAAAERDASFYSNQHILLPKREKQGLTRAQQEKILKDFRVPKVKDVVAFAIPAVFVWLCVPLLSMITTSCVGLISGTSQQAALNPGIAVINYSSKVMSFLFSGTTTMIAAAQERDHRDSSASVEKPRTARTLVGALQISILVGIGLGASVFGFARQLLALIIGGGSGTVDPNIMGVAVKFVKIRALGFPAAAMLGSAQTACLAQGDVKMPLFATIVCALTNLCLDLILIRNPHAWLGGAAGAAIATTIAQYVAAGWVIKWLTTIQQKPTKHNHEKDSSSGFVSRCTKGFLAGRMSLLDLVKRPSKEISKGFAPFVIPVITTQMGRCSASATIDHVVSSSLSTASMAANQILTSVYYGLVPVAESLSLAAQNFVPGIMEGSNQPRERAFAMRSLLKSFAKAAGLCGLFLAAIMGTLPLYCGVFTSDAAVRSLVTAVVPFIFVTCLKHGFFCSSEGILLGQKDLRFLGTQYAIYTVLIPYLLLQVKKAALAGSTRANLAAVWQIFLAYDLFRTVLMMGRIRWLERKRSQ